MDTNSSQGQQESAATVSMLSSEFISVRVEQNHCQGLKMQSSSCDRQ